LSELADPESLLEGTGGFMRDVKLRREREVNAAALERLIKTAYGDVSERLKAR